MEKYRKETPSHGWRENTVRHAAQGAEKLLRLAGGEYPQLYHTRSVGIISKLAASRGVQVTEDDKRFILFAFTTARALDTQVDTHGAENSEEMFERLVAGEAIPGIDSEFAQEFSEFFQTLSPGKQEQMRAGGQLSEHARLRAAAQTPEEYRDTTMDESKVFAKYIALDIPDHAQDANERREFNEWLKSFGRAGYGLDSFISDLGVDKKEGTTTLDLTPRTRAMLAWYAVQEAGAFFARTSPYEVATIASGAVKKVATRGLKLLKGSGQEPA